MINGRMAGSSACWSRPTETLPAHMSRFVPRASALVGWRYMNIDIEKDSGARTFNADIEMNGPFLGVNIYF
jgi:hypothetical protein